MKFCPNCGSKIVGIGKFCSECGANLLNHTDNQNQKTNEEPKQEKNQQNDFVDEKNNTSEEFRPIDEIKEEMKEEKTEEEKKPEEKKKGLSKVAIFFLIVFIFELVLFITGIVLAIVAAIHWFLIIVALLAFLSCFITYKVYDYRLCYICPKCGKKRVKHQRWIETTFTEEIHDNPNSNIASKVIRYTHHYHASYVCPNCGETYERTEKKSGGSYTKYSTGTVQDRRIDVKEF